jgi:hypothetical protein
MKLNYYIKNLLFGLVGPICISILLFYIIQLAKYSFPLWLIMAILLIFLFGLIKKRTNNFLLGQEGENNIDKELLNLESDYIFVF